MAKIVEILKTEKERKSTGDFNTVHLYKTGQFYTAYDWSAWIISAISYTPERCQARRGEHQFILGRAEPFGILQH